MSEPRQPKAWSEWFRFASDELEYGTEESTEYANLRAVEEENREALRARTPQDQPPGPRAA